MKQSILYLDDEPACLRLFMDVLGMDFDVRIARNQAEAFNLLSERQSNIIISDQKMPDVEGTRFLREVAEKYPRSCRVLLTGSVTIGDMFMEVGLGNVHCFLAKPWTEQSMRQALERASFILSVLVQRLSRADNQSHEPASPSRLVPVSWPPLRPHSHPPLRPLVHRLQAQHTEA